MKILLVHKVLKIKQYNNIYLFTLKKPYSSQKHFIRRMTKAALNVMYMIKIYK